MRYHSAIDSLNSNEAVDSFLHKLEGKRDKDYFVDTTFQFQDPGLSAIAKKVALKPWIKADFDGNGLTDILIIQRKINDSSDYRHITCIIDSGQNRFSQKWLLQFNFYAQTLPVVKYIDNIPMLLNYKLRNEIYLVPHDWIAADPPPDTLIFKFGDFINYNRHIETLNDIDSIKLETKPFWNFIKDKPHNFFSEVFKLVIKKDGSAIYSAFHYDRDSVGKPITGIFTASIRPQYFDSLLQIMRYVDFSAIGDTYAVPWNESETVILTIKFGDGHTKKIVDYGEMGSYSLMKIYRELEALRHNQNWQQVKN